MRNKGLKGVPHKKARKGTVKLPHDVMQRLLNTENFYVIIMLNSYIIIT